jgi:hypothetical protein
LNIPIDKLFLDGIREFPLSSLGPEADFPDRDILWLSSVPAGKLWGSNLKKITVALSFSSQFNIHD